MHPIKHTGMALLLFSQVSAAAVAELDMESSASVRAAGGVPVGKVTFVAGHRGRAAHFAAGAHVRLKPGPALTAKQGAIDMWVKPEWDGADQGRHTFWHMGGGQRLICRVDSAPHDVQIISYGVAGAEVGSCLDVRRVIQIAKAPAMTSAATSKATLILCVCMAMVPGTDQ